MMKDSSSHNKIQLLVTTVNLTNPLDLLKKLNVKSSFLIGNQTSYNSDEKLQYNNFEGVVVNRDERGVGINRNNLINHSDCDICILSDDDMEFVDNYPEIVLKVFSDNKDADAIIFNIGEKEKVRRQNTKSKKLSIFNYMNYGAARLAFRRESVILKGISFNTMFGGGCQFSCGEDSLFIRECLRKGLKIIALPVTIASLLDDRESSWFKGYSDKFVFDQGVFLALAHPLLCRLFAFLLCLKHPEYYKGYSTFWKALMQYNKGITYVKRRLYVC